MVGFRGRKANPVLEGKTNPANLSCCRTCHTRQPRKQRILRMSAGTVHTLSAVALATGFTVASLSTVDPDVMQYAAGAVVGIFVAPDCDVDKGFIAYGYIR